MWGARDKHEGRDSRDVSALFLPVALFSHISPELAGKEPFDKRRGDVALLEVGVIEDAFVEGNGCLDAFDHEFVKGSSHACDGLLTVSPMGDDLGDHRIIEGDDHHIRFHCRVDAHAESAWRAVFGDHPWRRRELFRIFGIDAAFEAVSNKLDVLLLEREGLTVGEPDLFLNEIDAGHHFGDRMLYLDTSIHLHEEKIMVLVEEELDGADITVMHGFDGFDRYSTDFPSQFFVDGRRRRFFKQFLMPALD